MPLTTNNILTYSQDYVLENENVLLRPLVLDDFRYLQHFSINEPEIWEYSLVPADGEENLLLYIQTAVNNRQQQNEYPFIVLDKHSGQYAGCTRFYDINPGFNTLQLGYTWYGSKFQGTGLNKNCKYLLLQFAFETCGVDRVEFRADNNNVRSIAAMKSIGCIEDGVLRSNMPRRQGGRRDSIVLSILKHEWHNKVKVELMRRLQISL